MTTGSRDVQRVHIIGTGLIGTSVGMALRRVGVEVTLGDRDDTVLAEAIAMGAGRSREEGDTDPQIVIAATPPGRVGDVLVAAALEWPDATLTHVASVQSQTLADCLVGGVPTRRLVGGHPMAGREVSGPQGARADLFDDRMWVVCPTADSDPERVGQVQDLARICGARPIQMSVEDHDAAVAVISHTPQVLATVLAGQLIEAPDSVVELAGQGLRDMTRIAGSNPDLWLDILRGNAASIAEVLARVVVDLERFAADLGPATEGDGVLDALQRGVAGQARIPGKHGGLDRAYDVVSVMVKDEPGQLASLFVAAGELGVNLEDVRIEHVLGRPSGLIDLSVQPEVSERLREGLTRQGFDVRS